MKRKTSMFNKKNVVLFALALLVMFFASGFFPAEATTNPSRYDGQGNCTDWDYKDDFGADFYEYTAPDGYVVAQATPKAGTECYPFTTDGNDGCYEVLGLGTQTVTVEKVGADSPECKDISHVEYIWEEVEPPELCLDPEATNYGQEGPCEYPPPEICDDPLATNYGQEAPCEYSSSPPSGSFVRYESINCVSCPGANIGSCWVSAGGYYTITFASNALGLNASGQNVFVIVAGDTMLVQNLRYNYSLGLWQGEFYAYFAYDGGPVNVKILVNGAKGSAAVTLYGMEICPPMVCAP